MNIEALNAIKYGGINYRTGDVLNVDNETGTTLVAKFSAIEVIEDGQVDGQFLYENTSDFSELRVSELKEVCHYLDISARGNKETLVSAILAEHED